MKIETIALIALVAGAFVVSQNQGLKNQVQYEIRKATANPGMYGPGF